MEELGQFLAEELKENKSNQIDLLSFNYITVDVTAKFSFKWYTSTTFIFMSIIYLLPFITYIKFLLELQLFHT
jgi:hypothetical protein